MTDKKKTDRPEEQTAEEIEAKRDDPGAEPDETAAEAPEETAAGEPDETAAEKPVEKAADEDGGSGDSELKTPEEVALLPLKETVVFPETMMPLAVGQPRSVRLIDDILQGDKMVALVTVKSEDIESPGPDDMYEIGTLSVIQKMIKAPDDTLRIIVQGIRRIKVMEVTSEEPYLVARVQDLSETVEDTTELEALHRNLVSVYTRIIELVPYLPDELEMAAANIDNPGTLGYFIASTMRIKAKEKQQLLEEGDVAKRLRRLTEVLNRELEVLELGSKIQNQVQSEMEKGQREYFLRQQLKAIQEELGETDETQAEVNELRERLDEAQLPEAADKQARRELDRLAKLPPAAAEYGVIRTYIDWILSLPWNQSTEDQLDIANARKILDEDHYDLEDVKDRILEFLAVQKLKREIRSPILTFVGPPGVGKTSLGQSVARALGRKFVRISVGGVRDEAEIRGHRRTYIGAMPGTIIRALRDTESNNPVFMIDEIDKMGADWRGDPSSAMLEVLDPEQHDTFRDHYLDLPFDLSRVFFITTANMLDTVPGPLRDRMEIIQMAGYIEDDKLNIARRYLIPRQLERHGLIPEREAEPEGEAEAEGEAEPEGGETEGGETDPEQAAKPAEGEDAQSEKVAEAAPEAPQEPEEAATSQTEGEGTVGGGTEPQEAHVRVGEPSSEAPEAVSELPELDFTDEALRLIIQGYTSEAGVRNLERQIGTIARKFARMVAEGEATHLEVDEEKVQEFLGKRRVFKESKRRTSDAGVSTGLAWTPSGGDILFIEARAMRGSGKLTLTGQLGEVMKESAQAALTFIRSIAEKLGAPTEYFQEHDIHVHVPAGAIPKDGPSAGVAITMALASMVTGRPVDSSVAMTGEVTLTGQVLPVGGIKEKTLAARRAGLDKVFLPARNEADVSEIKEELVEGLEFVYVEHVGDVMDRILMSEVQESESPHVGEGAHADSSPDQEPSRVEAEKI
ncbi:MAG TPA: endopeptidase La [Thermoleophilia bacterium]|nr:endopeptidase La [Thermoleophilia bacterium]